MGYLYLIVLHYPDIRYRTYCGYYTLYIQEVCVQLIEAIYRLVLCPYINVWAVGSYDLQSHDTTPEHSYLNCAHSKHQEYGDLVPTDQNQILLYAIQFVLSMELISIGYSGTEIMSAQVDWSVSNEKPRCGIPLGR